MITEILHAVHLDLLFRIDLAAMRPINGYGMTAADFALQRKQQWASYHLPREYTSVYSYVRLDDLKKNPAPYVAYVRDLYFWKLQDTFPLEQGLGLFSGQELCLFICDENDMDRPWHKHVQLLESFFHLSKLEKNYEHTVWGYNYSDTLLYVQESDDLLEKDEKPGRWLIDKSKVNKQLAGLKGEIRTYFPIFRTLFESVVPGADNYILDLFFSINK